MNNLIVYVYCIIAGSLLNLPSVIGIDGGKCEEDFGTCEAIFIRQSVINESDDSFTIINNNKNNSTKLNIQIDTMNQYESGRKIDNFIFIKTTHHS